MDLTTVKTLILFVTLASTVAFGVFPMFFVERFQNARWMGTMTSLSTTFSGGVSNTMEQCMEPVRLNFHLRFLPPHPTLL